MVYAYNCVGAVKYGLIIYYFGGGHLEIQYGRHAKCILLYNSSTEQDRNICLAAAPAFVGSRKQMGRFINCFTVVILKFKKATILDLIWSISPQRVVIARCFFSFSKCVCSVYAPYYVQAKIKSISSDTHQLHVIPLQYFTIKILIFDPLCRSEMLNKNKCQWCLSSLVFITGQLFRQASTVGTVKIALSETAFYCCIHM